MTEQTLRLPGRHRRRVTPAARAAVVALVWLLVVLVAPRISPSDGVHRAALFVHLISMMVGFGAVLLVDWFGLLWLARRRTFGDVLRTAEGALTPTWIGFTGLLASGLLLSPAPAPLTTIKLLAVLVVGLNGVYANTLPPRLGLHTGRRPPTPLLVRAALATAVSQAAWWTAVVIGFLNSQA